MPEPVIDLGEHRDHLYDGPRTLKWTGRIRRSLALVLVLVVSALTLAYAAPSAGSPLTLVLRITDSTDFPMIETADGVLVERELHRLAVLDPDGRERWHLDRPQRYFARVMDGLLIVSGRGDLIEAFDVRTGRSRWQVRGRHVQLTADFVVVTALDSLQVHARDDGRRLWSIPLGQWSHLDRQRQTLLVVGDDGRLTERELATGRTIGSSAMTIRLRSDHAAIAVNANSIKIFTADEEPGLSVDTVLDRGTLRPVSDEGAARLETFDCGPVLCARESITGAYSIVDRNGGAVLWRPQPWQAVVPVSVGLLILGPLPNSIPPWRVLDLVDRSGNSLASVWGWIPMLRQPQVDQNLAWRPVQVKPVLIRASSSRTEVAVLDTSGIRRLGTVSSELHHCQYDAHLLVCRTADDFTEVWRVEF